MGGVKVAGDEGYRCEDCGKNGEVKGVGSEEHGSVGNDGEKVWRGKAGGDQEMRRVRDEGCSTVERKQERRGEESIVNRIWIMLRQWVQCRLQFHCCAHSLQNHRSIDLL